MKLFKLEANYSYIVIFRRSNRHRRNLHHTYTKSYEFDCRQLDEKEFKKVYVVRDYASVYKNATKPEDFRDSSKGKFRLVDTPIRKYKGKLYRPVMYSHGSAVSTLFMDTKDVVENEIEWQIRSKVSDVNAETQRLFKSEVDIETLGSVSVTSTMLKAREAAQKVVDQFVFFDNVWWVETDPPVYNYNTFGLGHNHGGTGFFIAYVDIKSLDKYARKFYFPPEQREKAIKTVIKVAADRGDTNDVKRFQSIPENIFICK